MAKAENQKTKLLHLMKLLNERTDENHVISMKEILQSMESEGISAARKSIYSDIEVLRAWGMDIEYRKEPPEGYHLLSHEFELAELKLLVDAVQSSRFLSEKKSRSLIKKLSGLASSFEAKELQRQVFVTNRVKSMNESIYYNVDILHSAISQDRQIGFQYSKWVFDGKPVLKKNPKQYQISPWALTWTDENYYLIGYDLANHQLRHYRIDKMTKIEILDEARLGKELYHDFDPVSYGKKMFGMFGGEEKDVTMIVDDYLIGAFIDRFGKDISIRPYNDRQLLVRVKIAVSDQYFGWLTGLGKGVIIVSPDDVVESYNKLLSEIIENYNKNQG
ncbi:MAG: WYL domain-containing protein [Dorea sp.]|nr:WYL domain-containing protein [Dorea sp.]